MPEFQDISVVGAGIVGLAFATEAARRGHRVTLFERDRCAAGASVRNFGMIWPIGQAPGANYERALRSRARWRETAKAAGFWADECGSLHAVYRDDEWAVLREFAESGNRIACELVSPADVATRFPAVNRTGLIGALYSPTELAVDPRQALSRIPLWLGGEFGVALKFGTAVAAVEPGRVTTADGATARADQVIVCPGADAETLFPNHFRALGVRRCKLQMMRTAPQPNGWRLGPHLAGGLTIAHYHSFAGCPSLPKLKERFAFDWPEYGKYGIHVMASQNERGEVVIGDSHEYDADMSPFDKAEIDDLILTYLKTMLVLPDDRIEARWHGVYMKHPTDTVRCDEIRPGVHVALSPGGAGMTLSFGFAAEWAERFL
jgi:FAD dependent oxidoreductase TIGR03364